MNLYNELEKYIKDYIEKADVHSFDDLIVIRKLNDIVFYSDIKKYNLKYKSKQSLKKTEKIVSDFLESLSSLYKDYYQMRLIDGTIIYDESKNEDTAYSDYDLDTKERVIYIPIKNTVYDAFAIVHELFHDLNLDINENSFTRYVFTESLSILGEFLLEDFLKEKNIKDYCINNNRVINHMWYKSLEVDFNLMLISNYLNKGYLDEQVFNDIMNLYTKDEIDYIELVLNSMVDSEGLTIDYEQGYIIGIFISTYMYDRIKRDKHNISEVFELNEMLKKYTIEQVFDYLNLDYDDGQLTDKSYSKLEKSYYKYLKSR